jgi:hypothetical protein
VSNNINNSTATTCDQRNSRMSDKATSYAQGKSEDGAHASPPREQPISNGGQNFATPRAAGDGVDGAKQLLENSKKDLQYNLVTAQFSSVLISYMNFQNIIKSRMANPRSKSYVESDRSRLSMEGDRSNPSPKKRPKSNGSDQSETENEISKWEIDETLVQERDIEKLEGLLTDLLQDNFVEVEKTSRQPSSRVSKRDVEKNDDQEESGAETDQNERGSDVEEYIPDSQGTTDSEKSLFGTGTVQEALQYLVDKRASARGEGKKKFELDYTQPVVNRLFSVIESFLRLFVGDIIKDSSSGVGGVSEKHVELYYYSERENKYRQDTTRRPDSLLYLAGKGVTPTLNREALSLGQLVSLEHKSNIQDQTKESVALLGIERDFAYKLKAEDFLEPKIGYHIITDGIAWKFFRINVIFANSKFMFGIAESETVSTWNPAGNCFDFSQLSRWLLFLLKMSVVNPKSNELSSDVELDWGDGEFKVNQFLALGRRGIARVSSVTESKLHYVIKVPMFISIRNSLRKDEKMEARRIIAERQYLKMFHNCPNIVSLASNVDTPEWAILLEDVGISLDQCIVSGEAGKELAKVVFRDIWEIALNALGKEELCHADIHEGNICISTDNAGRFKATLVDLESAVRFGTELKDSPIKFRKGKRVASAEWDRASVCAILECLWDLGSIEDLETRVEYWYAYCMDQKNDNETPPIISMVSDDLLKELTVTPRSFASRNVLSH